MNKQAFFDGYINKDKLNAILSKFISEPKIRAASYAPEVGGVLGAGLGAYAGHKLSKAETDSHMEKERPETGKILAGSLVGGTTGSILGNALNKKIKWIRIRELLKES